MAAEPPGRLLQRRFLEPLGMTASALARAIAVPRSRVSEILSGRRGITPDTAARLSALFQVDPWVFLKMQAAWDLEQVGHPPIEQADTAGFLVGPQGVMPLPDPPVDRVSRTAKITPDLLKRLRAKAAQTPQTGPQELIETQYPSGQRAWESRPR